MGSVARCGIVEPRRLHSRLCRDEDLLVDRSQTITGKAMTRFNEVRMILVRILN